jgi:hypothetical protein
MFVDALDRIANLERDIAEMKATSPQFFNPTNQPYPRDKAGNCMCPVCVSERVKRDIATLQEYATTVIREAYGEIERWET